MASYRQSVIMFTGLIQSVGEVCDIKEGSGDLSFIIETKFSDMAEVQLGDSIAMDGVCLTVTNIEGSCITVDVSLETINKTTVRNWKSGSKINLEKSLTLKDKLGGHLVSGHVDATGLCKSVSQSARSHIYIFEIPPQLEKYVVVKGSIAINGVSLTVNKVEGNNIWINLIPHTMQHTNLGKLKAGDIVNVEIDTIARYVEKMLVRT